MLRNRWGMRLGLFAAAVALALVLAGCSGDGGTSPGDTTPPAAVTTLTCADPTATSIRLTWTAPGDDGAAGTASEYDIRYSTLPITAVTWPAATQCQGEPLPKLAGEAEVFTVTALDPNTTYYFAIKAADEVPNWSGLSNVPTRKTSAAISYGFALAWGSEGSDDGQFANPFGIAVDGSGNVYVADALANRIQKFTSGGSFTTSWGSFGSGNDQFISPYGVAVDASGNVYVSDTLNGVLKKFTPAGGFLARIGAPLAFPQAAAFDNLGAVYVVETGANRIKKFTSAGTPVTQWGSAGSDDGQLNGPQGIAVDESGKVYVADTGNDRVQQFSSDGLFLAKWGAAGTGNAQFDKPRGIAVDALGNVFVTDSQNSRVQVFTSGGAFLSAWGSAGALDGQFLVPAGIAVDALGNVYVTDTGNFRVQKFTPSP